MGICPKCKSSKWDETPSVHRCAVCKAYYISERTDSSRCPKCRSHHRAVECSCPYCDSKWISKKESWLSCPICGADRKHEEEEVVITIWTDGKRTLKYVFENGCAFVYLWAGETPEAVMYFHDLLMVSGTTANQMIQRFGEEDAGRWAALAGMMHDHRDDYLRDVPYFMERLGLGEEDAKILSIHFTGMGPEAIALKFGMKLSEIRKRFDNIMAVFSRNGIVVNDNVFTENAKSLYDGAAGGN